MSSQSIPLNFTDWAFKLLTLHHLFLLARVKRLWMRMSDEQLLRTKASAQFFPTRQILMCSDPHCGRGTVMPHSLILVVAEYFYFR